MKRKQSHLGNKKVFLIKYKIKEMMIIINEIIKITEDENGRRLVSARELHEFLEVGRDFTSWVKGRIEKYGFIENADYTVINLTPQNGGASWGGSNKVDYALTIDMSKELSMVENNERGHQARRYFIACESKLKEVTLKQLPQDYLSALKALVKSEEEKALMQPQVDYYQKVLNPNAVPEQNGFVKFVTTTAIAKDLQMSAQKLNKILNDLHIIYKQGKTWFLYTEHENKIPEYADYIVNEYGQILKFSEKGREWIIKLLEDNKEINIVA